MRLDRWAVKERLGHGSVKAIAAALSLSSGHVSQVLNGKRPDRRVAVHVARRLQVRLEQLPEAYYRRVA